MANIVDSDAWRALQAEAAALAGDRAAGRSRIAALFAEDPDRAEDFSCEAAGLFLDYSKNLIGRETRDALAALAETAGLAGAAKRMANGERINETEDRAVLHIALRDFAQRSYHVDEVDVMRDVRAERDRLKNFAERFAAGELKGYADAPLDAVVNIGIGGSDLGPQMAVEALRPYWREGARAHFVSNVDGQHLAAALEQVDPARTLFIVASKTFTTEETMTNAASARDWLRANACEAGLDDAAVDAAVARHFIALSTNERAVAEFGIDTDNMFGFWDWVGGRYSLWSAIGMSIALQVGYSNFERLLRGAHAMDEHFRAAPTLENMPMMLALVGVWNRNFLKIGTHAVLPYDQRLSRLPAYLQQADMESNGKGVRMDGAPATTETGPVIFGEPGTNGQHAFYQLIHQGTDVVSADFIAPALSGAPLGDHHEKLLANFLAQTEALMLGRSEKEARTELAAQGLAENQIDAIAPHKAFPGDRPTNSILLDDLTPERLGALIALYEHKIFCQGVIWGINSFDQWGVELGKILAKNIRPEIAGVGGEAPKPGDHDASTLGLLRRINEIRAAAKP